MSRLLTCPMYEPMMAISSIRTFLKLLQSILLRQHQIACIQSDSRPTQKNVQHQNLQAYNRQSNNTRWIPNTLTSTTKTTKHNIAMLHNFINLPKRCHLLMTWGYDKSLNIDKGCTRSEHKWWRYVETTSLWGHKPKNNSRACSETDKPTYIIHIIA